LLWWPPLSRLTSRERGKNIPKLINENLQQQGNPDLGIKNVAALIQAAIDGKVKLPPEEIRSLGRKLISAHPNPDSLQGMRP
jgi:hypothetical protein